MKKIRSKAPLRIGLAGGGTDLDVYCNEHGGYVLNTTISIYVHCNIQVNSSNVVIFESQDLKESVELPLSNKFELDGHMDLYKATYNTIIEKYKPNFEGFILSTYSDVPSGSGLGGSSTLVVSMIKAFSEWFNLGIGEYEIASMAFEIEREKIGIIGGSQDQYASAFGGFNFMEFYNNKNVIVNSLRIKPDILNELESSMVLYFTNIQRSASQIEEQKKSLLLKGPSLDAMHQVKKNAVLMKENLLKGNILKFAEILDQAWKNKKKVSESISNRKIDKVYNLAKDCGAISGKISGAGGGGFMFFIIDPSKKHKLIDELKKQEGMVINFNFINEGVKSWIVE